MFLFCFYMPYTPNYIISSIQLVTTEYKFRRRYDSICILYVVNSACLNQGLRNQFAIWNMFPNVYNRKTCFKKKTDSNYFVDRLRQVINQVITIILVASPFKNAS